MLYTGLRKKEVSRLTWGDVILEDGEQVLTVRASIAKNSKDTALPIHSWLASLLADWQIDNPNAKDSDSIVKVSGSMLKVLNQDLEFAGIPKTDENGKVVHLHACRHSFITLLARMGTPPHIIQKLARHSKIDMTMSVYTHLVHGDDSIAIESLPTPEPKAIPTRATGTDDSAVAKVAHVRPYVQNSVSDRILLSSAGNPAGGRANSISADRARSDTHNSLSQVDLGMKKTPLSPPDNGANVLGGTGLEPVTSCVSSRRSSQLS